MTNQSDKKKSFSLVDFINQGKLAWKLFRDPNVTPLVRFGIPLLGIVYLISPIDIIPDALLGFGQLDDIAVLMVLLRAFIALAPEDIVNMYRQGRGATDPRGGVSDSAAGSATTASVDDDVIDTEYRVVP